MTTRRKTLGFLGGVAMAALTATAAFAQEVTLKLEHFLPAADQQMSKTVTFCNKYFSAINNFTADLG